MFLPWKTASQSLSLRLREYNDTPYSHFFYFNPYVNRLLHQHSTCADFTCFPESKLGYFKASFVRNPYDRAYSGFRQLQRDIQEQPHASYPERWIRDLVTKQLSENFAQLCQAQFKFDEWLALVTEEQFFEVGRNSSFPLHPAHYWTHVAGQQFVNFIGRVESFEPDFERFLCHVGIEPMAPVNANVADLEGSAANNPFGYRYVDRMNSESIKKINRIFKDDFDLFGYERLP